MNRFRFAACMAMAAALTSTCGAADFWDTGRIKREIDREFLPSAEDYPDADGVVLYRGQDVEMQLGGNDALYTTESVHVIRRLFRNIDEHTIVTIKVYDGQELKEIEARTIRTDGSIIKLKKKDYYLIKGEGDDATLYSDTKTYRFTFAGAEKNAIVEYWYVIRKDYAFRRDQWLIQDYLPTIRNCYRLTVPRFLLTDWRIKWKWNYRAYNYPSFPAPVKDNPQISETDTYKAKLRFSWDLRDIPAFDPDPKMPPYALYWAKVRFAPSNWEKWDDIAKWYRKNYFLPQLVPSSAVSQAAGAIVKGLEDPYDKAAALYQYVQSMRYIAIDLGDGGYRPAEPAKVLERKYGDCKDKSTLLIAMMRSLGLKAEPVLMLTANAGVIDPGFPSMGFNHMIVKVELADGMVLWLDPTSKYCRANELPVMDQAVDVLVLHDDETGTIERTPGTNSGANSSTVNIRTDLSDTENARFSVLITYRGDDAIDVRYALAERAEKDMPEYCKSLIGGTFANAEINKYDVRWLDSLARDPELAFDFTVRDALQQQGDLWLLTYDPFCPYGSLDWLRKRHRQYPIAFDCPRRMDKSITITYPADRFEMRNAPKNMGRSASHLSFVFQDSVAAPGTLCYHETYQVTATRIPPETYDKVLQFYDDVHKHKTEKIIFTKRAVSPAMQADTPERKRR